MRILFVISTSEQRVVPLINFVTVLGIGKIRLVDATINRTLP